MNTEPTPDPPTSDRPTRLPTGATLVRETPHWTADSVPPALLSRHHTTAWAELVVTAGAVEFIEDDSAWRGRASPGHPILIVPERGHHIDPSVDAVFCVRFYAVPASTDSPS